MTWGAWAHIGLYAILIAIGLSAVYETGVFFLERMFPDYDESGIAHSDFDGDSHGPAQGRGR